MSNYFGINIKQGCWEVSLCFLYVFLSESLPDTLMQSVISDWQFC